jgi:tetratricopeptide (TPR) repeat protein
MGKTLYNVSPGASAGHDRANFTRARPVAVLLLILVCAYLGPRACADVTGAGSPDPLALRVEYGIALALGGKTQEAESIFASALSDAPGDARVLTNLGNLHLLEGKPETALAFYDRAGSTDSLDAGIMLNRALAFMVLGDQGQAQTEIASALRIAGGVQQARFLLGLSSEEIVEPHSKQAESPFLTKAEVLAMLDATAESVAVDSTGGDVSDSAEPSGDARATERGPSRQRRSAGSRAVKQTELATLLYWKY